ncbi:DUF2971 domain-containing protein [Burkholderia sp. Bp9090]|uniref:DUF2971 domain-containing protein n=1 Tax=Burkholderia sp. Bp9090 TaxID=2184567 RepID=UPI000F5E2B0B|nr:DUF2971 domain-containing protein [Burkholderia sp. Bp9090]RQZ34380.1 DUF2971 domain-containing protein [Burkholderia sp. Bp9090]
MMRPPVLYKYRHFNDRTIELLCADRVYYADPSTFNDPLDTRPCVEADCDIRTLERTVQEMVRRRVNAEMRAAADAVKYRGPKTMAHIEKHSEAAALKMIDTLQYQASDPEYSDDVLDAYTFVVTRAIEDELLRQYNKGILSLASRHDCPLMWSHYGDQHRGLCIGYAAPTHEQAPDWAIELHEVVYGGDRNVRASLVAAMVLEDNAQARREVDSAVLLRKAPDWQYEKEWRLLGSRGASDSPLEMVEVVFGMRCDSTVMHTVARALSGRDKEVRLYEMHEVRGTFELTRSEVDVGELSAYYPRRAQTIFEEFAPFTEQDDESPC